MELNRDRPDGTLIGEVGRDTLIDEVGRDTLIGEVGRDDDGDPEQVLAVDIAFGDV